LYPFAPNTDFWDGPRSISEASLGYKAFTTAWSVPDLMYYNNYAAAMYCPSSLKDLTCCSCDQFIKDVDALTLFEHKAYDTLAMVTVNRNRNEVIVTFRGSIQWLAWTMDNTQLIQDAIKGIRIHRGVHLATMSVYNDVS
jgi:hypothetical protein